nr:hypothetical protein [Archaeoglobus neptunius]
MKDGDVSLCSTKSGPFSPINYPTSSLVGEEYPVPPQTPLEIDEVPKEGDIVFLSNGERVRLVETISSGGEGTVYQTDVPNLVAKIYRKERITADLKEKVSVMVKLREFLHVDKSDFSIVWPKALVFNSKKEFVGYVMSRADGTPLQKICNSSTLLRKYRHVKRSDLVKIAINTLKALDHLYSYRVLMGDVNQLNILVDEKLKVYLIDTDSYQIGPFVCKVGKPEFSHPDWIGSKYEDNPRSPRSEGFALAILVFMILLPGKHPFSKIGGEGVIDNIKQRFFPYAVRGTDVSSYERAPAGYWRYIWSHTPPKVKEILHDILVGEREPLTYEELRATVNELIYYLEKYRSEILSGKRTDDVFPTYYFIPDYIPKKKLICPRCKKTFEISLETYEKLSKSANTLTCHYCHTIEKVSREINRKKRKKAVVKLQVGKVSQTTQRHPKTRRKATHSRLTPPAQKVPTIVVRQHTPERSTKKVALLAVAGAVTTILGVGVNSLVVQVVGLTSLAVGLTALLRKN